VSFHLKLRAGICPAATRSHAALAHQPLGPGPAGPLRLGAHAGPSLTQARTQAVPDSPAVRRRPDSESEGLGLRVGVTKTRRQKRDAEPSEMKKGRSVMPCTCPACLVTARDLVNLKGVASGGTRRARSGGWQILMAVTIEKTYAELVEELQYPTGTHSLSMWQQKPGQHIFQAASAFEPERLCDD
jgi:hypothetical protein